MKDNGYGGVLSAKETFSILLIVTVAAAFESNIHSTGKLILVGFTIAVGLIALAIKVKGNNSL